MISNQKYLIFIFMMLMFILLSCTSNPFWQNDEVKEKSLTGTVILSDSNDSYDSIYVWLEEFNLGTYTDDEGKFKIVIPPAEAQNDGGGFNGDYQLYFWLSNYEIQSVTISFSNGEFSSIQDNINKNGKLSNIINLQKLLSIKTDVVENGITYKTFGHNDTINVIVELTSNTNYTFLIHTYLQPLHYPYRGEIQTGLILESLSDPLNKTVILRQDDCDVVGMKIKQFAQYQLKYEYEILSTNHIRQIVSNINIHYNSFDISSGDYKVYPYISFPTDEVPDELINSIHDDLLHIKKGYYKIPIKREDAIITIDFDN